jgi:hypothetical protein
MENDNTLLLNKDPSTTSEQSSMLSLSDHSEEVSSMIHGRSYDLHDTKCFWLCSRERWYAGQQTLRCG